MQFCQKGGGVTVQPGPKNARIFSGKFLVKGNNWHIVRNIYANFQADPETSIIKRLPILQKCTLKDNWSKLVALQMLYIKFYWKNARNKRIFNFSCFQKSRGCIFVSFVTRFVLSTTVVKQKMSKNFICHFKGVPATISHKVTQILLKIRCIYCLLFKTKKALWM